jgi:hypothetical protein
MSVDNANNLGGDLVAAVDRRPHRQLGGLDQVRH